MAQKGAVQLRERIGVFRREQNTSTGSKTHVPENPQAIREIINLHATRRREGNPSVIAGSPEFGETLTFVVLWFLPVASFQGSPLRYSVTPPLV
jgi:hypothetical protein